MSKNYRFLSKLQVFVFSAVLISGCSTNQVPTRIANTYEVTGKVYCDTPVFHNVETIVVRWIQATIAPEWEPVCSARRADATVSD